MTDEKQRQTIGDYFTLQRGTTYKSKLLGQPGRLLLGLLTIQRNGGFRSDSLQTYGGESPPKLLVQPGELYVSLKDVTQSADLLGAVARLPSGFAAGRLTQDTVRLAPKSRDVPLDYLYWLLRTPQYRAYCRAHATGTTNLGLSRGDFLAYPAPEPTSTQIMLAEALGTLDDKIELNKQMCKTLEAIGKAIFKHWFIDFEFPNEEGRPYKSSGGEMVYNEELEKEIPKGWEISNVNKEFNLVMGQSPPGSSYNETGEGVVFFQGRTDFGHRFPSIRMFCTEPTRFAKKGDTLISVRAPVGDANLALQDCCIGRGLAAIRHKSDYSSYTYYLMMTLKPTFDHFEAQGTVFGSLSKADFEKIKVLAPSKEIINRFQNTVGSIDKKIEDNTLQTLTLSSIRDSLLPKLMSGRIRVPVKVR